MPCHRMPGTVWPDAKVPVSPGADLSGLVPVGAKAGDPFSVRQTAQEQSEEFHRRKGQPYTRHAEQRGQQAGCPRDADASPEQRYPKRPAGLFRSAAIRCRKIVSAHKEKARKIQPQSPLRQGLKLRVCGRVV